jgi:uncharacterized protein YfaS (alpha-2-macroglobulin family)
VLFRSEYQDSVIYQTADFYSYEHNSFSSGTQVFFFTDRSIYRPGQTIYFKGILASHDTSANQYRTIGNTGVNVVFYDPNSQQVKTQGFTTNEFGSFSGTFVAPTDRLPGRYMIKCNYSGGTQIRVEEYKRPKFKLK